MSARSAPEANPGSLAIFLASFRACADLERPWPGRSEIHRDQNSGHEKSCHSRQSERIKPHPDQIRWSDGDLASLAPAEPMKYAIQQRNDVRIPGAFFVA